MKLKNRKGFTLVEILVVIAIVGILSVIAIPSLINNINKAKISNFNNDLKVFEFAMDSFYTENDRFPTAKEWGKVVKESIDGKFEVRSVGSGENVYEQLYYKSPFNEEYVFNFINEDSENPASPIIRIDIGGFNINQTVVDLIKKDDVEFKIDESKSEDDTSGKRITNKDLKDEYLSNKNVTIYDNGTIWVLMDIPK